MSGVLGKSLISDPQIFYSDLQPATYILHGDPAHTHTHLKQSFSKQYLHIYVTHLGILFSILFYFIKLISWPANGLQPVL